MRICEINDIASVASELSRGLEARGHEVRLIQPKLEGGSLPRTVKPFVAPVRAADWLRIIRRVRRSNFDVVHIHYAYLGMMGVLGRFPYILHCHGTDVRDVAAYSRSMVNRALGGAEHVFYSTPDLGRYILPKRADAEFLPNPIDTQMFHPLARARESRDVFVCCALTKIKGADRILAACRRLAAERPDIRITAIAGGEYTRAFRALANVRLIQHQSRSDLPGVIAEHGVVIGWMHFGIAGMAELEAMACARPVVMHFDHDDAYDIPPPFVRAEDGAAIAGAVARLVDDPNARQEIGDAGREWVIAHHDLEMIAARVEQRAERIVAARTPR